MSISYLDDNGLLYFWQKIKSTFALAANAIETINVNSSPLTVTNKSVNITVAEGTDNGTVKVNGVDVSVHGLGSAAYTASTAYDASGAAAAVLGTAADSSSAATVYGAKAYADGLVAALDSSATATSGYALTGVTLTDGKVTAKTEAPIPTATSDLTNDSGFITIADVPEGSVASTTTPIMDGTATTGVETAFARGDHVHPTDTSRAPIASPTFTGTPAAPTAATGTNTTQIATTAFVQAALPSVPSATSTTPIMDGVAAVGSETTWAKGDHVHPSDTSKLSLSGGTMTGALTLSGAPTSNLHAATKKYVDDNIPSVPSASSTTPSMDGSAAVGTGTTWARADHVHPTDTSRAPIASPTFTGTPAAPTATAGTNTTQIATTAFVTDAISTAIGGITGISYEIVSSLPATGSAGVIYLISNSGTSPNVYDEYIYVNNAFEKIGTTAVDLSGYVQTTDLVAITNAEIDAIVADEED